MRTSLSKGVVAFFLFISCILSSNAQDYVNFEAKQTSPVRLSPDGTRLFAVNTPDGRLSVFDLTHPSSPALIAEIPVGVEPVSVNALNNDEVWVVNEVSDSVSIVSTSRRIVVGTLQVKDEPADVVFAGGKAFVSVSRRNEIHVFDVTNHTRLAVISLLGQNPRALAVSADGAKVFTAFALSGNHTTVIPQNNAPPPPTPTNPALPPPPQVALIVDATNSDWYPSVIKYNVLDNDVAEVDVGSLTVTRYFSRVGTINLALAVRPGSGEIFVANTDARNRVRFEPNLRGHVVDNRMARINSVDGVVTNYDLNPGIDYNVLPNPAARSNALAQPTAIAFVPDGSSLYVASFGTDRVAHMDPNGNVLARIEIGPNVDSRNMRGPRGLAFNAAAQRLYVLNRIANTISILDTASDFVIKEIPIGSFDPTPTAIRQGRGFLYDARLSGNGTAACAACHVDAEMDMIAWDLGDPGGSFISLVTNVIGFHPMKGPMMTQTFRGLSGLAPFHWRGDRTNFLHFSSTFDTLLGDTTLNLADMQAFEAFINTIRFEPNPNRTLDRQLPASLAGGDPVVGSNVFLTARLQASRCVDCHGSSSVGATGTSRVVRSAGAVHQNQDMKVAHLRNLYQMPTFNRSTNANNINGFGMRHDGAFADMFEFFSQPPFSISNAPVVQTNLISFLLCWDTGMAPGVGYSRTLTASNILDPVLNNEWQILESQSVIVTNLNLILKGTIDGRRHGLLYQAASNSYRLDTTNFPAMTRAEIVAKIQTGDTLTLMGAPPGSGQRLGLDRDLDGVLDADVPSPTLQCDVAHGNCTLHWPLGAVGFVLESSESLAAPVWTADTNAMEIVSGRNYVTNQSVGNARFYRLKAASP